MAAQFTNLLEFQPGTCASGPPSPGTNTARRHTLACNPITLARRRKHKCNQLSLSGKQINQLRCQPASLLQSNIDKSRSPTRCEAGGESSGNVSSATKLGNSGSDIQLVPYTVVVKADGYTLRLYEAHTAAVMAYERRDEGFIALGAYFDGANKDGVRLAETQPVIMRYPPLGQKTMQLYVGTCRDGTAVSQAPFPTDPAVSLEAAGGEVVAVGRFEGVATPTTAESARKTLVAALQRDGISLGEEEKDGLFRLAQYGPLNSLSTRINEILLRVAL